MQNNVKHPVSGAVRPMALTELFFSKIQLQAAHTIAKQQGFVAQTAEALRLISAACHVYLVHLLLEVPQLLSPKSSLLGGPETKPLKPRRLKSCGSGK